VDGASKSDTKEDVSAVKDEDDKEDDKAKNTPAAEGDGDNKTEESSSPPPTERFRPKRPKRQPAKFKDTDIDQQQSKDNTTTQSSANSKDSEAKKEEEGGEGGESKTPPIIEPQEYCKKFCQPLKKQQNKAMNAILKQGIELGESMESDDANTAANSAGNQVGQGGGGTTDGGRDNSRGMFPQDKELMLQHMQNELHQLQQRNNQVSGKMRHEMVSTGVPLRDSMSGLASMMQYAAQRDHRQSRRGSNNSMFDNMSLSSFPMDSTNMANSPNPFKEVINKDVLFNAMNSGMTPGDNGMGGGDRGNSMLNNMSDMELKQRMMRVMSESASSMGMMMNTPGNDYNFNDSQLGKRKYSYDRSGGGVNDAPSSPSGPKKSFLQRERIMDAEMRNHMLSALQGSAGASSMMTTTPGNMDYNHDGMLMQQANAIQHARMMAQFNQRNVGLPSLNSPTEDADQGGSPKKKSKKTPKKSNTSSSSKKKKNTDGKKLTAKEVAASILQATGIEKPKRPFSAYNLFFQLEREFIKHEIADGRKPTDDPMIRDALDAVANGVPKPEDSGGVKPGLLCIDKEVFKSILMKNQMSGEFSCYGNCIVYVNLGALLLTLSSPLYPPSLNYTDSKLYADPNLPSRYTHMKLDKYWYSISHKQKRKHRKTEGGSVGFIELTKMVSARWKQIDKTDPDVKEYCQKLADIELDKYKIDMDEYKQKVQGAELNATSNEMMQLHGQQDQYSSMPPLSSTKKKSATKSKKKQTKKNSSSPPPDNVQSNFGGGMDMMNMMSMMSNGGDMARFTDLAKMSGSSFLNNTPGNNSILPGITGTGGLPPPPFGGDGREQQAPPSVSTAGDRARMAAQMNVGRMNQGLMNDKMMQITSNFGRGGTGSSDVASSDMLRKMAKLAEEEARFRMMQEEMQDRRGGDSNRFNDQQQGGQQGGNFSGRGGTSRAEDEQFDDEVERFLGSLKQEIKQNRRQQQMGGGGGDMPNAGGNFNAEEMARMMAGRSSGGIGGGSSSAFQNRGGSGSESRADMMARMMQMVNNDSGGGGGADNLMMEMMARRLAAGDSANNNRSMPRPPFNEDNFQGQQSDGGQGEQGSIEKV